MKASHRTLSLAVPLGIMLLSQGCSDPPKSVAGDAGFVDAYIDNATLNSLMSHGECAYVRFYDVRRTATDTYGTVVAIATKSTGEPLYNGSTLKYRMFDVLTGGVTIMRNWTTAEAQARIRYVKDAGEKSYAVNFKKTDLQVFTSAAGCSGIKLVPERGTGTDWTMRAHPVKLVGTTGTVNPAPTSIVGEPCPSFCGSFPSYYIHLP